MYAGCTRLLTVYIHLRLVCGYDILSCNAYYAHAGSNANTVYPVLTVMVKLVQSGIGSIGYTGCIMLFHHVWFFYMYEQELSPGKVYIPWDIIILVR